MKKMNRTGRKNSRKRLLLAEFFCVSTPLLYPRIMRDTSYNIKTNHIHNYL